MIYSHGCCKQASFLSRRYISDWGVTTSPMGSIQMQALCSPQSPVPCATTAVDNIIMTIIAFVVVDNDDQYLYSAISAHGVLHWNKISAHTGPCFKTLTVPNLTKDGEQGGGKGGGEIRLGDFDDLVRSGQHAESFLGVGFEGVGVGEHVGGNSSRRWGQPGRNNLPS